MTRPNKPQYATSLVHNRGGSATQPLYVAEKYPCYQIDFASAATGKNIAATKRRIRWRFGFASPAAVNEGLSGVDCRGEEHEVVLVWSVSSGKRLLMVDGNEVHYSFNKESKFEFSWMLRGNHTAKVVAHANAGVFGNKKGWKQFDFSLDGCSYFDFPKIYELGMTAKGGGGNALAEPTMERREQSYMNYSLDDAPPQPQPQPTSTNFAHSQDHRQDFAVPQSNGFENLRRPRTIEFNQHEEYKASDISRTDEKSDTETIRSDVPRSAPFVAAVIQQPPVVVEKQDLLDFAFETTSNVLEYSSGHAPQPGYSPQNDFIGMDTAPSNTHVHPMHLPPQPSVPYDSYVNNVMYSYNVNPPAVPPQDAINPYNPSQYSSTPRKPDSYNRYQTTPETQASESPADNYTYTQNNIEEESSEPVDNISRGMQKLVNLEDLTQPAEKKLNTLTMNPIEKKRDKKSKGLPPKEAYMFGAQPSLMEMQSIGLKEPSKKEVMRPNMLASAHPGAVVVYGGAMPPQYAPGHNGYTNTRYY